MGIAKLIVPNRGEIAVRIARACREMRIASVLAHAQDDDIRHVRRFFDEAVSLGPSYLDVGRVIDAARRSGADALHPGYGFLSERPELAAACEEVGITFVGPSASSIAAMGSKAAARALMQREGVPVVPGYDGEEQSLEILAREAGRVGFPLLIKASAGGGGKGMKIVRRAEELRDAVDSARRESVRAFGDDRLILERYIEEPRHVEFQIFGGADGEIVHLFERDCSIQRRHQKVVEETPAPRFSAALREQMAQAAVAAARAVKYRNAGTIEFLLDPSGDFYFLEMNTRLQVEHPVTELVTGVDLVHAQLEVASGGALPWKQSELRQRGHAIEVRVYAEDPDNGFLPQSGTIALYREPSGPGVRVDSGVAEGSEVGVGYDPLLAKVICHAESRDACIDRLTAALRDYVILGTKTNISWLGRVIAHPAFRDGLVSTRFLTEHAGELERTVPELVPILAAAIASSPRKRESARVSSLSSVWDAIGPWGRGL